MSYALSFTATDPAERWAEAGDAAAALVAGEPDGIANMANVAALIWQAIPHLNWAGFYRFDGTELVLGPFQGKAACIRIPLEKGVCGAAARLRASTRRVTARVYGSETPGIINALSYTISGDASKHKYHR